MVTEMEKEPVKKNHPDRRPGWLYTSRSIGHRLEFGGDVAGTSTAGHRRGRRVGPAARDDQ